MDKNNLFNNIVYIAAKNPKIINTVLLKKNFPLKIKYLLITIILNLAKDNKINIIITSETITHLLKLKDNNLFYYDIYDIICSYCNNNKLNVFTYNHLYQLVLQPWINSNSNIPLKNKKKMIQLSFPNGFSNEILHSIYLDQEMWFDSINQNKEISELIEWLCYYDKSNVIMTYKIQFETKNLNNIKEMKEFKKQYHISLEEYKIKQENAKKNGLCKYVRNNQLCPKYTICNFYHGPVEDTYGIQYCKYGNQCKYIQNNECNFLHKPSDLQISKLKEFYSSIKKIDNTTFMVDQLQEEYIDNKIKTDPYIILKKINRIGNMIIYKIPTCDANVKDINGNYCKCNKNVVFASENFNKFYCSYIHMYESEKTHKYTIKQNFLKYIF